MDGMPLHPMLVHLPLALAVVMPLLTTGVLMAWRRELMPRRTWAIVIALQAVLFGSALIAERTGHQEEERVEELVGEDALEIHESAGEAFVWVSGVVLLLCLTVAAVPQPIAAQAVAAAAVGATLVVLFLAYRTGEAGARLVYQHGAASAYTATP